MSRSRNRSVVLFMGDDLVSYTILSHMMPNGAFLR
jgi:hypothetical protein